MSIMEKNGLHADFVLVVGSCNVDLTCHVEKMPLAGETVFGNCFYETLGGKAVCQAVAASKLGADVRLSGMLGDDHYGQAFLKLFNEVNISTEAIEIVPLTQTGTTQVTIDATGAERIVIIQGANERMTPSHIDSGMIENLLLEAEVGLFQFEIDAESTKTAMSLMKAYGRGIVILNCAPAVPGDKEIHSLADVLILNETDVLGTIGVPILNYTDMQPIMQKFFDLDCNTVIITLGKRGAVFATRQQPTTVFVPVPAPTVDNPLDPKGAGDAFCGALAFTFLKFKEMPLLKKIEFACFVANYSVNREGTYESYPLQDIVNQFF